MNCFPKELIYVLAFAVFALVPYLLKRLGAHEPHEDAAPKETLEELYQEVKDSPAAFAQHFVSVDHFGRSEASSAPSASARSRFDRASILGNKRDVQNAIVIATIVGRCRAYEPHDVR
jgi:hypothetical protein